MDFKRATDILGRTTTQADVAEAAGVSHAAVRQARLETENPAYRSPPPGWEDAVAKLARARAAELEALAEELEG